MPLLEVQQIKKLTATVTLEQSTAFMWINTLRSFRPPRTTW